jgi:hypothetical protein
LKDKLPKNYDFLLIDGPQADRMKMFEHADLFNWSVPLAFDDCQERYILEELSKAACLAGRNSDVIKGKIKMAVIYK